jgi:hypothetical protein
MSHGSHEEPLYNLPKDSYDHESPCHEPCHLLRATVRHSSRLTSSEALLLQAFDRETSAPLLRATSQKNRIVLLGIMAERSQ